MLLLRSLFFAIVVPGAVVVWLPLAFILSPSSIAGITWTPAAYAALMFISAGAAVLLWCIGDFIIEGRGTLAPIDPPTRLVRNGLYRYVRNPMYGGVLLRVHGSRNLLEIARHREPRGRRQLDRRRPRDRGVELDG